MCESPWERIVDPPPIPEPCTAVVLRLLPDAEFEQLLRANLVPRTNNRNQFQQLWIILAFNDDLADRTFDILEVWLEAAETHLRTVGEATRARKFGEFCDGAWNRLTKIREFDTKPGPPHPGPHTTGGLFVRAINRHRPDHPGTVTAVDQALWASVFNARDRAHRGSRTTKSWAAAPTFTSQLIDAVRDHQRLTLEPNTADRDLWALLRPVSRNTGRLLM